MFLGLTADYFSLCLMCIVFLIHFAEILYKKFHMDQRIKDINSIISIDTNLSNNVTALRKTYLTT